MSSFQKFVRSLGLVMWVFVLTNTQAQTDFNYSVYLEPVSIQNLYGLHSYAHAQHNGKWLFIGGRKDGLHARQPNSSFPASQNHTDLLVVDVQTNQFWTASLASLSVGIKEQLQATNLNFYQDADSLYLIGGYAFAASAADHITFPNLTSVHVSGLIDAIISGQPITSFFKQITDQRFANTGGYMGKIGSEFILVGGQRFDGRYNPMGNPTYVQTYSVEIKRFKIDNSGSNLSVYDYSAEVDPAHLRRRDYNLIPQIFPNGSEGYTISSGVFQSNANLPFLYPVDISATDYTPRTEFNQYLSNYHSAHASMYDSLTQKMHTLFFGGMSQYYYQNGTLIQDDQVPFVKTISRVTRSADNSFQEYQLPIEMPSLKGAGAAFILNNSLPHTVSEIVKIASIQEDTVLLGHIYGGISSPTNHPFTNNQTSTTSADASIYRVFLVKNEPLSVFKIDGSNPYEITIYPIPAKENLYVNFELLNASDVYYMLTDLQGKLIKEGTFEQLKAGKQKQKISLRGIDAAQNLMLTVVFEGKFFTTKRVVVEK